MWVQWRDIWGGDAVRLRAPDIEPQERESRAQRVANAIASGLPAAEIAKREHLHPQTVRKQARRLRESNRA